MVQDVAAVEEEGGLGHGSIDALVVVGLELVPLLAPPEAEQCMRQSPAMKRNVLDVFEGGGRESLRG